MKTVRMLTGETGGNGEALVAGKTYTLEDASADHWLKRSKAELVLDTKGDEGADGDAGDGAGGEGDGKPSDGLTVAQLKEALEAKKVAIPDGVTLKADLAALLDAAE